MNIADFEEELAHLIGRAMEHHGVEEVLEYLGYQTSRLREYRGDYPERMKIDVEIEKPKGGEKQKWERAGKENSE